MDPTQRRALALAALMLTSTVAMLLPPTTDDASAQGGQDTTIPVPYQQIPGLDTATLYFWEDDPGTSSDTCNIALAEGDASLNANFCAMRVNDPRAPGSGSTETFETRNTTTSASNPPDGAVVRFAMDTDDGTDGAQAATFPFTLRAGSDVIRWAFDYDSNAVCNDGVGTALEFHMRLRLTTPDQPTQGPIISEAIEEACNAPDGDVRDGQGHLVTARADLTSSVEVGQGQILVAEIFPVAATGNLLWSLIFESSTSDSRVQIETPQAIQRAMWATDDGGRHVESFDPNAPESERVLVGRVALRSPFGGDAIPESGLTGALFAPDGTVVELAEDADEVDMTEIRSLRAEDGARKVFRFAQVDGEQVWSYPSGVASGQYTFEVSGDLLGASHRMSTPLAMGSFDFAFRLIDDESTLHQLVPGTSTTFLLQLTNNATSRDTYALSTTSSQAWTVDVAGVDQNDRVSLDPGQTALIRVKLTPPSDATSGDASLVQVTARSITSTATSTVGLQGTIADNVIRDVGLILLQPDAFEIGIGRDTDLPQIFAWNRGTAVDGLQVNIVEDSLSPNDPELFSVDLDQRTFDNVAPGEVVRVPVTVSSTDQVTEGSTFDFNLRVTSVNRATETIEDTINTVVTAIKDFDAFVLDHRNTEAQSSIRFGKFNLSNPNPTPGDACAGGVQGGAPEECGDYSDVTYHRFTVTNLGDQSETFELSLQGNRFTKSSQECVARLPPSSAQERLDEPETGFVRAINVDDVGGEDLIETLEVAPGDTARFFLRVVYDGSTPYLPGTASNPRCVWEAYIVGANITLPGARSSVIDTETRIFGVREDSSGFETRARARLSLDDHVEVGDLWSKLPRQTGITPGEPRTVPFTLSQQAGHEDQVRVTLEPRNLINDLIDEGWTINLTGVDVPIERVSDTEILVPTLEESEIGDAIHATGTDVTLGLRVQAPISGVQENERHTFTVIASQSTQDNEGRTIGSDEVTMGLGIQVGEDFAFELTPSIDAIQAQPGETLSLGLTVANQGASRDTYRITSSAPTEFGSPIVRPARLDISPGTQKASSIEVTIPENAATGSTQTVTASVASENVPGDPETVSYDIDVRPAGTLTLTAEEDTVRVGPGGETSIAFTIENSADSSKTVRVQELFAPPGWTTTLSDRDQGSTVSVPAQGSTPFTYVITAPSTILEGSRYTFAIRAEDDADASDFANGMAHAVVSGQAAVELEPEETTTVVDRGGSNTLSVLVRNLGTSPTWYELVPQFETPGWTGEILDQDGDLIENATIRVPEQTFQRIQLQVTAPDEVSKGHSEAVTLVARAQGQSSVRDTIELTAEIHDFDIGLEVIGPTIKDAAPGDDVEYRLNVTNRGNGIDRIRLSFEDLQGSAPLYPGRTDLTDDTTPELQPGETLTDVSVFLQVPSPNQGPIPTPEGVTTVLRANSTQESGETGVTVTSQVITRLVNYKRMDVDNDGADEVALDLNQDPSDGFEVFQDKDATLISRGELNEADSVASAGLYDLEGDDDGRREHIIDTDGDGLGDVYYDPDRARVYTIPYTYDANRDGEPEHPIDGDFDGLIDGTYEAEAEVVHKTVNADFSGDGRDDVLIDMDDDTFFDTFVDPHATPQIVSGVDRDGDTYKLDTDGNGKIDTHYDAQTQSIEGATEANLQTFVGDYWYFIVLFVAVLVLFGVIVVRRL